MDSAEEVFKISGVNIWKTKEAKRIECIGVVGAVKARTRV
jgi:hypothetical protein